MPAPTVICFGEILWDILPTGEFPGGAPFNVAYHLKQLGLEPAVVSAIGDDERGRRLLTQLRDWKIGTQGITEHAGWPTGTVRAKLNARGDATYDIVRDVAWDLIPIPVAAVESARTASAIVFGSLAQRSTANRLAFRTLLEALPSSAERVFDVNLRKPHDNLRQVRELARQATLLKLNSEEAKQIAGEPDENSPEQVARRLRQLLGCTSICITAGGEGAGLLHNDRWTWEPARPVTVADTVGAGDAFLAALLATWLRGETPETSLAAGCRLGEFVASKRGATPPHESAAGLAKGSGRAIGS